MDKAKAAEFKDKGNKALSAKNFDEAIAHYTEVSRDRETRVCRRCTRAGASLDVGEATAERCTDCCATATDIVIKGRLGAGTVPMSP